MASRRAGHLPSPAFRLASLASALLAAVAGGASHAQGVNTPPPATSSATPPAYPAAPPSAPRDTGALPSRAADAGVTVTPTEPVRSGMRLTSALDVRVIHTNNPGPDDRTGQTHRDTVVQIQPSIAFDRRGSMASISGDLAVSAIDYLNKSHAGRLLPRGRVSIATRPVEGFLFLDAFARVDPTNEDPFATRLGDTTSYTLEPRTQYSVSPYVATRLGDAGSFLARSDNVSTRITDPANTARKFNATSQNNFIRVDRSPTPLGYSLEARTREESDERNGSQALNEKSARITVDYAFDPQVVVGVIGGTERVSVINTGFSDQITGARLQLRPTPRTNVRVTAEKRYFGRGWDASLDHRTPFMSFSVRTSRSVTAQDTPQFTFNPGDNVRESIYNSLGTRYGTDEAARLAKVDEIFKAYGLPNDSPTTLTLYAAIPQIRQNLLVNVGIYGRRNAIYAQYGILKAQSLPIVIPIPANDQMQTAATVGWNTRLSPVTTLDLSFESLKVEGLGATQGDVLKQYIARSEVIFNVSPKGSVTLGGRYLKAQTGGAVALGNREPNEKAIYVGLRRRF